MGKQTKATRRPVSWKARLRYRFDTALARGPITIMGWLALVTLGVVLIVAVILAVFRLTGMTGGERPGFFEAFWQSGLRVLDPGTFSGDTGWATRIAGLIVTISGVIIAGSLIGLIAASLEQRIDRLQKGRSEVLETRHTLILGWSERVPPIIAELVIANESERRAAVVVLAQNEKPEMEETLRTAIRDMRTTKVVCRSGEPWSLEDLDMVHLAQARSVVVIGGGNDADAVKTILAIQAHRKASGSNGECPIIAEVDSADTASSLRALVGDSLVIVRSTDVVAELTAQACRQRGLSTVFRELLDFDGDELYLAEFPALVGFTFAQCQLSFDSCSIVGVLDTNGVVALNPPAQRIIERGEQLIGIAADDSLFRVSPPATPGRVLTGSPHETSIDRRRIVVVGWSGLGPRVVAELDEFFDANTTVEILLDPANVDVDVVRADITTANVHVEVSELIGGPEAVAAHAARLAFNEVIVLGYRDALSIDEADARSLLTLVAFRQVCQDEQFSKVRLVAEVLDQRNARLAQASGVDDFIVSDELTSLMLAQLSEHHELAQVFADLFSKEGCSIELQPAPWYGGHEASTFADVVATGSASNVSIIGYRNAATSAVVLNPRKSAPLRLAPEDELVVIADGTRAAG